MTYRNVRSYEIGPVYGAVTEDFLPVLGIPHYYEGYSDTPIRLPTPTLLYCQQLVVFQFSNETLYISGGKAWPFLLAY